MRAFMLLQSLKTFLEPALAECLLPDPSGKEGSVRAARLFFGNVPDEETEEIRERFPFAVVRWMSGEDEEEGKDYEDAAIILGVYSPTGPEDAELTTAALLDHLRQRFMENRTLADRFELQLPLRSAKPDPERKQHQYHIATLITRWEHQTPRRPLQGDFDE